MPGTRKLGRATDARTAMLRALVTFLLENGKIETTVTRAKEVSSLAEKMITIAKTETLANKRNVMAFITKEDVATKLFKEIAPKYADRNTVTHVSQRSVLVVVTQQRWLSSSLSNSLYVKLKHLTFRRVLFIYLSI